MAGEGLVRRACVYPWVSGYGRWTHSHNTDTAIGSTCESQGCFQRREARLSVSSKLQPLAMELPQFSSGFAALADRIQTYSVRIPFSDI